MVLALLERTTKMIKSLMICSTHVLLVGKALSFLSDLKAIAERGRVADHEPLAQSGRISSFL